MMDYYGFESDAKNSDSNDEHITYTRQYYPRGAIIAALNLAIDSFKTFTELAILPEGTQGHLPNLDLINTITTVASQSGVNQVSLSKTDTFPCTYHALAVHPPHSILTPSILSAPRCLCATRTAQLVCVHAQSGARCAA
jgi:hypothetical protein